MNALSRRLAMVPFRLLPAAARRRLVQAAFHAAAAGAPADALRELLTLDSDLAGLIDETALEYDGGVHAKHRLTRYHDFFVERIRPEDRVLDIGCGYGAVAHAIASRVGAHVTGLDMDPANVAKARRLFPRANLVYVEGEAPAVLPEGPFDVVVLSNVLEHVRARCEFLQVVQRRTGAGRWLIRVPMADRDWRVPLRQELGLRHFSDPTHVTEYTRESLEREIQEAGFTIRHLQVNWGEIWAEASARPDNAAGFKEERLGEVKIGEGKR